MSNMEGQNKKKIPTIVLIAALFSMAVYATAGIADAGVFAFNLSGSPQLMNYTTLICLGNLNCTQDDAEHTISINITGGPTWIMGPQGPPGVNGTNGINQSDIKKVNKSGDTMTGNLNLNAILNIGGKISSPPAGLAMSPAAYISGNVNSTSGVVIGNTNNGSSADFRFLVKGTVGDEYMAFSMPGNMNSMTLFGSSRNSSAYLYTNRVSTRKNLTIGTVQADDLIFGTNNSERMRIFQSGNVYIKNNLGIGVSSPSSKLTVSGNVNINYLGGGFLVKEGSNAKQGIATCVSGKVVVANTAVTANSRIFLTVQNGTPGASILSRNAGVNFTISCTDTKNSTLVAYEIFEPS